MADQAPRTDSPSSPVRGCGQRGKYGCQKMRDEGSCSDACKCNTTIIVDISINTGGMRKVQ